MSMIDLVWLFCGAFLGGLASLILTAAVSANGESEKREELMIRNKELEEELKFWRNAGNASTSPNKGGYVDTVKLLHEGEKAILAGRTSKKTCAICGREYKEAEMNCPFCGSTATKVMLEALNDNARAAKRT